MSFKTTDNYSAVIQFLRNRGISTQEAIQLANHAGGRKALKGLSREELEDQAEYIYESYTESIPCWFDLIDFD